jgi:hypothetical protein
MTYRPTQYDNARFLDLCRDNSDPGFITLGKMLLTAIEMAPTAINLKHIKLWLVEFARSLKYVPQQYLIYSRDNNYWSRSRQNPIENPLKYSRKMVEILDALTNFGYVENQPGYYPRDDDDKRRACRSRCRATEELIVFLEEHDLCRQPSFYIDKTPLSELRDGSECCINKPKPKEVKEGERILKAYNELLRTTDLGITTSKNLLLDDIQVKRIFNPWFIAQLKITPIAVMRWLTVLGCNSSLAGNVRLESSSREVLGYFFVG